MCLSWYPRFSSVVEEALFLEASWMENNRPRSLGVHLEQTKQATHTPTYAFFVSDERVTFGQPAQQWSGLSRAVLHNRVLVPIVAHPSYVAMFPHVPHDHTAYLVTSDYCVPPPYCTNSLVVRVMTALRLGCSVATKTTVSDRS